MNIAMITNGRMPIPSSNMGSIENIVWNYKEYLEKDGHTVTLFNSPWIQDTIYELNTHSYDFIHVHFELFVLELNKHLKQKYMLTCHAGALSRFTPGSFDYYPGFNYSFSDVLEAPGNFALSEQIKELYLSSGYNKFVRVLRNPVETDKFSFRSKGNGRALCIGRIQTRKQQAVLAELLQNKVTIDFVGPNDREWEFGVQGIRENNTCTYLGNWEKEYLYKHVTDYSCLVHFSKSEVGAPLVVLEAMAAGLSIVTTEAASANLTTEPFITIVSENERDPDVLAEKIQTAIDKNRGFRDTIRKYAFHNFDYSIVSKEYIKIAEEFIKQEIP